jgi:hypothetical protein
MRKSQERSGRVTVFPPAYEAGSLGVPTANNVTERSRNFARNTSGPSAQSFRCKVSFEAVLGSISPSTLISLALNAHRLEMSNRLSRSGHSTALIRGFHSDAPTASKR